MLAPSEFDRAETAGYLDTATYGLPPRSTVEAIKRAVDGWRGREHWMPWEQDGEACRALFARIVGTTPEHVALVPAVSSAAGLVASSVPARPGDNIVLYEQEFASTLFPWFGLQARGVEIRLRPLEGLVEAVDDRTALVAVSHVQSSDGAVADLEGLKRTGAPLFVDATQAAGAVPVDVGGIDYLAAHPYKWLLCPRGLSFLYVSPKRLAEIEPWTAGWKSRERPYDHFYGAPRDLTGDARRLDVSLPWLVAAGAHKSLEMIDRIGIGRIAEHDLGLARRFAAEVGVPEPASPIVQIRTEHADAAAEALRAAGVSCSARAAALRFCFHLYNDEEDVARVLEALSAVRVFAAEA